MSDSELTEGQEDDLEEEQEEDSDDDQIIKRIPVFFNSTPDFSLPSFAHFKPVLDDETNSADPSGSNAQQENKKKREKTLTLLQYPFKARNLNTSHPLLPPSMRPDPTNTSNTQQPGRISAKYKPGVRSLKLDLPLEMKVGIEENRFSDERAREFAKGIQDHKKINDFNRKYHASNDDECDPLDVITLGSTLIPEQTNYAVGILRQASENDGEGHEDELHIVPLDQILQMRPSLDYLDHLDTLNSQADKLARQEQGLDSDSEDGSDEVDEEAVKKKILAKKKSEANEAKAIQVSVVSNAADGDRMGAGLRSGGPLFAPLRAAEAETPINLIHYHSETKEADAIRKKMYSSSRSKLVPISSWTELLKI